MKKIYLFLLINTIFINLNAQSYGWAKREGQYAYDYGYGIVTDASGNVYVAGKYEYDANFSGTTITCAGNHDFFLAKYNSSGSLIWITTGGGADGDYAQALSTDGTYLYITGEIEGYNGIIPFQGSPITVDVIGDNDIFLAKYDMNGTLIWAKSDGWWYSEKGKAITTDNSGNVFITGYYTDSTMFNSTIIPSMGYRDMYVAKYDSNGNFLWAKHAGGPQREEGTGVVCDASGNVYVCGMFCEGANFEGTVLSAPFTGNYEAFLAKYSPTGTLLWVKPFGSDYHDVAFAVTKDNAGTIYVTGEFNAYATFDSYALVTSGGADVFVAAFNSSGSVLWASKAGGVLDDRARGIGTDGTNLFITGQYGGTAIFGGTPLTAADSSDVFMAKVSNTGTFSWAMAVGGIADTTETLGYESGIAITGRPGGEVYATGSLLDGGTFGATTYVKYSRTDIFIAKILQIGTSMETTETKKLIAYPNPTSGMLSFDVTEFAGQELKTTVHDCLGQIVSHNLEVAGSIVNIDLSTQKKGAYFVEVKTNDLTFREMVILQ